MLHKICGPDGNKCTDMIAEDSQYHKEGMTNYLTKHLGSEEKTSTATTALHYSTTPYAAALNIVHVDEPLFKDSAIFFITALRDEFCKYFESHGVHNVTSYRS